MKAVEFIKINWRSIWWQRRKNIALILVIGIFFGLIYGAYGVFTGMKKTLFEASNEAANGKNYVIKTIKEVNPYGAKNIQHYDSLEEFHEMSMQKLETYHGRVVATYDDYYIVEGNLAVVSPEILMEDVIKDKHPPAQDRVSVLLPSGGLFDLDRDRNLRQALETDYEVIGTFPSLGLEKPTVSWTNPWNIFLKTIYTGNTENKPLLIESHDGSTKKYIEKIIHQNLRNQEKNFPYREVEDFLRSNEPLHGLVLAFHNEDDLRYEQNLIQDAGNIFQIDSKYFKLDFTPIFTSTSYTKQNMEDVTRKMLFFISLLTCIAIFIFVMLLKQALSSEYDSIALYYAVGASKKDLLFIYFLYFFELYLLILIVSTIISGFVFFFFSLITSGTAEAITKFYSLNHPAKVYVYGFDSGYWFIFLAMLISFFIAFIFSLRTLMNQKIAKNIKRI